MRDVERGMNLPGGGEFENNSGSVDELDYREWSHPLVIEFAMQDGVGKIEIRKEHLVSHSVGRLL